MFLFYDLLLHFALVLMMPLFVWRMIFLQKYRAGLRQRLGLFPDGFFSAIKGKRPIWLHCVSVGESIAAVPLARALKERYPDTPLVVSTVTDTGNRVAREKMPFADAVFYLPLDLFWVVRRVVRLIAPEMFVVVETEIWPNLFREFSRAGVPVALVNGRISDHSAGRYKAAAFFMRHALDGVSGFGMQSPLDAERIAAAGAEKGRIDVTGNIKFDQPELVMSEAERVALRHSLGLRANERLLLAGSTHEGEETAVLDAFINIRQRHSDLTLLLAPRHPERFARVEEVLREKGLACVRRTKAAGREGEPVILLDTMGELGKLYAVCDVAFVGGSLVDTGGHNLLEPAGWGKPLIFGSHTHNFREIAEKLLAAGGGCRVEDAAGLQQAFEDLLLPETALAMGGKARGVVEDNRGALERTMALIGKVMNGRRIKVES